MQTLKDYSANINTSGAHLAVEQKKQKAHNQKLSFMLYQQTQAKIIEDTKRKATQKQMLQLSWNPLY